MQNPDIIHKIYKIQEKLGDGVMGEVMLGLNTETNERVALKLISPYNNPQKLKYLKHCLVGEANVLKQISNKNVIGFRDFQKNATRIHPNGLEEKNWGLLVTELATFGELFQILEMAQIFSEDMLRYFLIQFVNVMEFLHLNNFIHRDLKLENVLIGKNFELKLIDFGFSKFIDPNQQNKTMVGTESYMCPQVVNGMAFDGKAADVFALGVCVFSMATGQPPFLQSNDQYYEKFCNKFDFYWNKQRGSPLRKDASPELIELIRKTLAKSEDERWTIQEIKNSAFLKKEVNLTQVKEELAAIFQTQAENILVQNVNNENQNFQDGEGEYRSNHQNEVIELNPDFENIQVSKVKSMRNGFLFEGLEKLESIQKVADKFEKMDEFSQYVVSDKKDRLSFELAIEGRELEIGVDFYEVEGGFGVVLRRSKGAWFDFLKVKKAIKECF